MPKIRETEINIKIAFVKIYRDDIDEIVSILRKEEFIRLIEVEANNFVCEPSKIGDLECDKIRELKIRAYIPDDYCNIEVDFNKYGVRIHCDKKTTLFFGVAKEIEDYLRNKIKFFGFLTKGSIPFLLLGISTPVVLTMTLVMFLKKYQSWPFILAYLIVSLLFLFLMYLGLYYKNEIYLRGKKEYQNFFIRNKDQLLVNLVVGIILAVMGFLLGRLTAW